MKYLILTTMFFSYNVMASCLYKMDSSSAKITWTAYKTPKKIGVNGEFTKFVITPKVTQSENVDEIINQTRFEIDANSVSTGNPARDKTIVRNFFQTNGKAIAISGNVSKVSKDSVQTRMLLGASNKEVKFTKMSKGNTIKMEATINVLDFDLKSNLDKLAMACKALHEGITWPDVKIAIEFQLEKNCK